jgi:hypothetical protein
VTFTDNPTWIDGSSMSGAMMRRAEAVLLMSDGTAGGARGGVRPGDPGLVVSLAGSTINVTAGVAACSYAGQGIYRACATSAWTGTVAGANPTFPRIDLVYLRVWDNAVDSSGLAQADIVYLQGTAASSPVAPVPTAPQIYIPLANISVPASGGGSPSVDTSVRPAAIGPGGIGVGSSTPGVHAGQYRDDGGATGPLWRYNGTTWEPKVRLASGGQVNVNGSPSGAAFAGIVPTTTSDFVISGRAVGDTQDRVSVRGDGLTAWGPGNASTDVTLARTGAAAMTLTGSLTVTGIGGTLFARKTASQSVTNSTTLQDDTHMQLSVTANSTYRLEGYLIFNGAASAANLKMGWSAPSGATLDWIGTGQNATATTTSGPVITNSQTIASNTYQLGTIGTGTNMAALIKGLLIVGGTGGTFKLQWAQATANATATTMVQNSHIELRRVA